ncbi:MAG: hypothetical protein KDA57_03710 [Planctomycetales bacterium]|nr:hypothetical protein [Planctomycetales bacterium]
MYRAIAKRLTMLLAIAAVALTLASHPALALAPDDTSRLTAALDQLDQWIGDEANGDKWRKYLGSPTLRATIEKGAAADPAIVSRVLEQYLTGVTGLDLPQFVAVRREIEAWREALKEQYLDDLPKLAWASRGDYQPASRAERLAPSLSKLRQSAKSLERTLGTDTQFANNWKRYLRWERLQPHLAGEVAVGDESFADLTAVLKRFRSNVPGLENPAFTQTANALDEYRGMFEWYLVVDDTGRRSRRRYNPRDLERRAYQLQLLELEKQLSRHQQTATIETSRKVDELVGLVQRLDQSPQLINAIRSQFTRPNVFTQVTESTLNRLAQRPVHEMQPVRDCILGASIRGCADSAGFLTLETLPAHDHVAIELQLSGNIHSNTVGLRKPVRILSRSLTSFTATKQVNISDDRFVALAAGASARTNSKVRSIKKTGGQFAHRLVERIAWKKVGESKSQSEYIASQHAKQKIINKFNSQVADQIVQARHRYDREARPPLVRVGMFPEYLQMASTDHSVGIEARLASYEQISTDTVPIETSVASDLSMRVHETAINNFLPTILAGVGLAQEAEDDPPKLQGDFPSWLDELAQKHGGRRQSAAETPSEPALPPPANQTEQEQQAAEADTEFKPFSLTLNRSYPISVKFDDQQLTLRIRVAELKTIEEGAEQIRENWDFILTFQVIQNEDGVVLRRIGDVEPFPTGFDPEPRWGDKLPGEDVATRGALTKILNKRAASKNALPRDIELPPIQFTSPEGVEKTLVLRHLDCDNGWLTLGYALP